MSRPRASPQSAPTSTTSSNPPVLVTLTFASLRPQPRGGVRGRASLSTSGEPRGDHAPAEAGRVTAPGAQPLSHSLLVQVSRWELPGLRRLLRRSSTLPGQLCTRLYVRSAPPFAAARHRLRPPGLPRARRRVADDPFRQLLGCWMRPRRAVGRRRRGALGGRGTPTACRKAVDGVCCPGWPVPTCRSPLLRPQPASSPAARLASHCSSDTG